MPAPELPLKKLLGFVELNTKLLVTEIESIALELALACTFMEPPFSIKFELMPTFTIPMLFDTTKFTVEAEEVKSWPTINIVLATFPGESIMVVLVTPERLKSFNTFIVA